MKPALLLYPHISSYPVLMLLGFIFGWILARSRSRLFGLEARHIDNIALLLPVAGLFGARFFARLFYARVSFLEAWKVWEGDGLVFYGGFLFGAATVIAYALARKIRLARLLDCVAPGLAVGLMFGRIGCFLGGCCWGDVCTAASTLAVLPPEKVQQVRTFPAISGPSFPLSVTFPPGSDPQRQHFKLGLIQSPAGRSLPVHPVQLYEAGLAGLLAFALHRRFRAPSHGSAALSFLAGYAVIRFGTEYLRADNKIYAFGLTFSQTVSLEILLFCFAALLLRRLLGSEASPPPERPAPRPLADSPLQS